MNISCISVILSCDCNLNCSYCILSNENKCNRQRATELQSKTVNAIKDGTFLSNIVNDLNALNQPINSIESIDFWGQETTISLPFVTERFGDWMKTFPKLRHTMFSTNGTTDIDILKNYLIAVESNANKQFDVEIQISYDGEWATKHLRGADPERIKSNFRELVKFCFDTDWEYVRPEISIHSVFSNALLDYLMEDDSRMDSYEQEYIDLLDSVEQYRGKIKVSPGLGCELPAMIDSAQGKKWAEYLRKVYDSKYMRNKNAIAGQLIDFFVYSSDGNFSPLEGLTVLNEIVTDNDRRVDFNQCMYCGACYNNLKIMYDGTIVGCQNYMFNLDKGFNNSHYSKDDWNASVYNSMIDHKHHFNPQTDKPEDYKNIIEIDTIMKEGCLIQSLHQTMSEMILLAKAGQIDSIYLTDRKRLLEDGAFITMKNVCPANYIISSGDYFVKDTGYIRLFGNGVMDIVREVRQNREGK